MRRLFDAVRAMFSAPSGSTRATFDEIYAKRVWGNAGDGKIFSGDGSRGAAADAYIEAVSAFLKARSGVTTVVDVGCGDFHIGSAIVARLGPDIRYIGIDVSGVVIEHLKSRDPMPNVEFRRLDAARDPLPDGDVVLIRQVLQHLSNAQIRAVLNNIRRYECAIITEHWPEHIERSNLDISEGAGTRVEHKSAVMLDQPPFSLKNLALLLDYTPGPDVWWKGKLLTWIVRP